MSADTPAETCHTETPRKRVASYASVSKLSSLKRRRISMLGGDLNMQQDFTGESTLRPSNSVDRFVPSRPKTAIPLTATPRTNRIGRLFGLSDDRILNYKENEPRGGDNGKMFSMLRRSASSLFDIPPRFHASSVVSNLTSRQQCLLVLDAPGMTQDPFATPITWSRDNHIAVACGINVYYQNLDTRAVFRLCKVDGPDSGELSHLEWGGQGSARKLALGTSRGVMQVRDAGEGHDKGGIIRMWRDANFLGVGGLDWNQDLLAVGLDDGSISLFDIRSPEKTRRVPGHKGKILNLKWNAEGSMLASSDDLGMVYIWDKRAGKELLEEGTQGHKMRHRAPVKALAWCPWKPDLLATGSLYPEGTVRVWSSSSSSALPTPTLTIPLNTAVLSLHWSPHCKELLSTHGSSFEPLPPTRDSMSSAIPFRPTKLISTPLTNSITVHDYPSGKRLLNLTSAHLGAITHSCLSPNGEDLFTVCSRDETLRKWHVWKKRPDPAKKESAFDKWSIR